ncbi:MAG: hypothetical protein LBK53_09590 [Heliobacteriaceae bacterium]|nr:hypothetical protein [Heliobacteriaceae bacterium]
MNYPPLETLPNETIADSGGRETPIVRKTTLFRTAGNPRQVQDDVTRVE